MDLATKNAALGLIETLALAVGVAFGGWSLFCLVRQQFQKAAVYFLSAVLLVSLQNFSSVSRNTFSLTGISLREVGGATQADTNLATALNTLDFLLNIIGYIFLFRSILLFARISDGRARASEAVIVWLSAIILTNIGSILQIFLKSMVPS